ncbi:MAG: TIGR01459 family HAD-type hydrolase, partial [Rhodospirillales bacterium]|nr:TIGR01459 family HAD-type hydrolase [Rhodospirillales bacterium]
MTSGDLCREACAKGRDEFGTAYHYLGLEKDRALLEGLPYQEATELAAADFILNLGTRQLGESAEVYRAELSRARDRELPMLCANPD